MSELLGLLRSVLHELFEEHKGRQDEFQGVLHNLCHRLDRIEQRLHHIHHDQQRIITMSESADQAIADLSALVTTLKTNLDKFETDVTAALAQINTGTLTAEQQAGVDSIKSALQSMSDGVAAADAALPAPPSP